MNTAHAVPTSSAIPAPASIQRSNETVRIFRQSAATMTMTGTSESEASTFEKNRVRHTIQ
jgi:hypothetical protein